MAVLLAYILISYLCFRFLYHKKCHQKSCLVNWPIFGMLPSLLSNASQVQEFVFEILKASGGTFEFKGPFFANLNYTITSDPTNVHHILSRNFANYFKGHEFKIMFEPFGHGIFNSDSDTWLAQRKIIHCLINDNFKRYHEKVVHHKVANTLIPILEHVCETTTEIDMQDVFQRLSYDTACILVLGSDPGSLSKDFPVISSVKAFDYIGQAVAIRNLLPPALWKLQKWLKIGTEKKLSSAIKTLDQYLHQCISKRQEELSQSKSHMRVNHDLLTAYLVHNISAGHALSSTQGDMHLRDFAFNLMVAGRDTISSALTWFFWLIACNPEAETKILEEIKHNLQLKEEKISNMCSTEKVNNLVYLHGAFCETLRLYPPVHMDRKNAIEADIIPTGHHVGKNATILFSFYAMGRMQEIWGNDCMEFKPERWISASGKIRHVPSYKFIAFNAGPRACLGRDMAFTELKMIAAVILSYYKIQVVDGHCALPSLSAILKMKHGLKVKVIKRGI